MIVAQHYLLLLYLAAAFSPGAIPTLGLSYRDSDGGRGENVTVYPSLVFPNPRLLDAYVALQAWKLAIVSDPFGLTRDWSGPDVCNYTGVFCSPALDDFG